MIDSDTKNYIGCTLSLIISLGEVVQKADFLAPTR